MVYAMEELAWGEVRRLGHRGALFMLPIGPLEDHGPHLPCGVDWFTAREMTRELAETLSRKRQVEVVVLPCLALGASMLYSLGCVRIPMTTMGKVVEKMGMELAREGVRKTVVVTTHGAISHLAVLDRACARVTRNSRMQMISPCREIIMHFLSGGLRQELETALGRNLGEEAWQSLTSDYHAGAWETGLMLRYRPELVADFHRELPPHRVEVGALTGLRGLNTHRGYFGDPALGSKELGDVAAEVLIDRGVKVLEEFLDRPQQPSSNRWWAWAAAALVGVSLGVAYQRGKSDE
ncbi:MAG: creatininase family protein [Vulcanimicrobiota bacterium]